MPTSSIRLPGSMLVIAALVGCTTPATDVRVDQAEGPLPNCRTFAWHAIPGDAASFADQRVKAAVMAQLESKGYKEAPEKPDCKIAYQLTTREIPKSKPSVGVGVGGGSRGVGGGIGVSLPVGGKRGFAGTFALDVIDANKNAQIWKGSIDTDLKAAEISDAEAQRLAEQVLAAYPNAQ